MTREDLNDHETAIHDAWAMLNLTIYALEDVLMRTELVDGRANEPDAVYSMGDAEVSALWGALEAMRTSRSNLWGVLQKI